MRYRISVTIDVEAGDITQACHVAAWGLDQAIRNDKANAGVGTQSTPQRVEAFRITAARGIA